MKKGTILESNVKFGLIVSVIIVGLIGERPLFASDIPVPTGRKILEGVEGYDTPVLIGPKFLEVNDGDGEYEEDNHDESGDPPLDGYFSSGGGTHYKMAMNSLIAQNFEVHDLARVEMWAPRIVLKPGFHAKPDEGNGYFRAGIPVFSVNCINLVNPDPVNNNNGTDVLDPLPDPEIVDDPAMPDYNSPPYDNFFEVDGADEKGFREFCENEIDILNYHFANKFGNQLIRFKLRHAVEWQWDLSTSPPVGLTAGDSDMSEIDEDLYYCISVESDENCAALFNSSSFADSTALTMLYFRHPGTSNTSYGSANSDGRPFAFVNYKRTDTTMQRGDFGDKNGNGLAPDLDEDGFPDDLNGDGIPDGNGIRDDDWGRKAAQEHEIGHAFWLQHTWDERHTNQESYTNIMNYGGSSVGSSDVRSGFDDAGNYCNGGTQGNREVGFWVEPFDGTASGDVCHRYVNGHICYDSDGNDGDDWEDKIQWSQVEIIYYAAVHYKETWDRRFSLRGDYVPSESFPD